MNEQKKMIWGLSLGLALLCSGNLVCAEDVTQEVAKTEKVEEQKEESTAEVIKKEVGRLIVIKKGLEGAGRWTGKQLRAGGRFAAKPFVWCGTTMKSLFLSLAKFCVNGYCKLDPRGGRLVKSGSENIFSRLASLLFDRPKKLNEKWNGIPASKITMKKVSQKVEGKVEKVKETLRGAEKKVEGKVKEVLQKVEGAAKDGKEKMIEALDRVAA